MRDGDRASGGGFWDASAPAAEAEAVRLREVLAPLRVGLVHGRLKAADRDAEMARFRDGDLDVLVGTTVVEVGVDVPEATMMVVQGADRFGLAQLHQLRGRVGRGEVASFCVLVSDSTDETAQARLKAVAEIRDGFELAERDWELRREGDVLGLVQSGLPRLRIASLQRDDHRELAVRAREAAEAMLDETGALRAGPRGARPGDGERLAGARRPGRAGRGGLSSMAVPARATAPGSSAGRVIAGSARGIRLVGPGEGTRPLGDRVKQALFAILEPTLRGRPVPRPLRRQRRGRHRGALARRGVGRLRGVATGGRSRRSSGTSPQRGSPARRPSSPTGAPPAGLRSTTLPAVRSRWLSRTRHTTCRRSWLGCWSAIAEAGPGAVLAADGVVVAKHFWKAAPVENRLLRSFRQERFGETMLTFYRWTDEGRSS